MKKSDAPLTLSIANYLDNAINKTGNNYGLYSGKSGILLAYAMINYMEDNYNDRVNSLYEEIKNNLEQITDISFSSGLIGIGWAIDSVSATGTIKEDTTELLNSFDDLFYQLATFQKLPPLFFDKGNLGLGFYFYQRLYVTDKQREVYRFLLHRECLILIATEITGSLKELLEIPVIHLSTDQAKSVSQSYILLYLLSTSQLLREVLPAILIRITEFMEKSMEYLSPTDIRLSYLMYAYRYVGFKSTHSYMILHSEKMQYDITGEYGNSFVDIYKCIEKKSPSGLPNHLQWKRGLGIT